MSYVAISSKFSSDVKDKLRRMRHKEVNTITDIPYRLSGTRTDVLQWAWGEHLHLKEQIPAKWCCTKDHVSLRVNHGDRQLRINVELAPELVCPPGGAPSGVVPMSPDDPEIKALVEREMTLADIAARWDKVDKEIMGFLNKCKSVNEALKLWPQVEMYIPEEYIRRVNEKQERNKGGASEAAEALKSLDVDHLTTAAVISRMSGQPQE